MDLCFCMRRRVTKTAQLARNHLCVAISSFKFFVPRDRHQGNLSPDSTWSTHTPPRAVSPSSCFPSVPAPWQWHSSPSCPTSSCSGSDTHPAPTGHSTSSWARRTSPRFEVAQRSFVKQLQKSQPPAMQALSPRNLVDTEGLFSLRCVGLMATGRRGKKSQQGAHPYCCDMSWALLCYSQNIPALTAVMLQHRAYVVLLNFCFTINLPSNIMLDG